MGSFALDRGEVVEGAVQPPVVVPVDSPSGRALNVGEGAVGATVVRMQPVLWLIALGTASRSACTQFHKVPPLWREIWRHPKPVDPSYALARWPPDGTRSDTWLDDRSEPPSLGSSRESAVH